MSQVTTHTKNHVTYTSCPHVTIGLPKKKKIPAVATLAGYSRPCAASSQSQGCICRPIIEVCFSTSASRPLACSETKAYSRSTTCCVSPSASGGLLQTKGRSVVVLFLPTRRLGKPSNPPMTSTERNSLIETLKASNDLDSCLAVCAVSGSISWMGCCFRTSAYSPCYRIVHCSRTDCETTLGQHIHYLLGKLTYRRNSPRGGFGSDGLAYVQC